MMRSERLLTLRHTHGAATSGPVLYWVSRDCRIHDNWALAYAQHQALERKVPLRVVFCLVPNALGTSLRQYHFMLHGIEELSRDLAALHIPLDVLCGIPVETLPDHINMHDASLLVTDFEPLNIKRAWTDDVLRMTTIPLHQVDAHNIVPCWHASPKQEFAAYTLRPKLNRLLPTFLEEVPPIIRHPFSAPVEEQTVDVVSLLRSVQLRTDVEPVTWIEPGEKAARRQGEAFLSRLQSYGTDRNDPTKNAQSDLSPYFHFGQLAPLRIALDVSRIAHEDPRCAESAAAFLEELIVRRELADNFTHYNPAYDSFEGFPAWAQQSLNIHRADRRDHVYELDTWEQGRTHDELWNAAQGQLVRTGKMHGYMRMYWAKKILEWSATPEEAMHTAITLNDRYELDGSDPNGYAGIAWSIGGVHDRAWFERPVYGKIRYMNANGCAKKFSVNTYIARYDTNASTGAHDLGARLDL